MISDLISIPKKHASVISKQYEGALGNHWTAPAEVKNTTHPPINISLIFRFFRKKTAADDLNPLAAKDKDGYSKRRLQQGGGHNVQVKQFCQNTIDEGRIDLVFALQFDVKNSNDLPGQPDRDKKDIDKIKTFLDFESGLLHGLFHLGFSVSKPVMRNVILDSP